MFEELEILAHNEQVIQLLVDDLEILDWLKALGIFDAERELRLLPTLRALGRVLMRTGNSCGSGRPGTRVIPHRGHLPGPFMRMSLSCGIGHIHSTSGSGAGVGSVDTETPADTFRPSSKGRGCGGCCAENNAEISRTRARTIHLYYARVSENVLDFQDPRTAAMIMGVVVGPGEPDSGSTDNRHCIQTRNFHGSGIKCGMHCRFHRIGTDPRVWASRLSGSATFRKSFQS